MDIIIKCIFPMFCLFRFLFLYIHFFNMFKMHSFILIAYSKFVTNCEVQELYSNSRKMCLNK